MLITGEIFSLGINGKKIFVEILFPKACILGPVVIKKALDALH